MSKRLTKALATIAGIVALAVLYFLTLGHCFLPFRGPHNYKDERLEHWRYSGYSLSLPSSSPTIYGSLARLTWQIKHPGQARLLAAAKKLQAATPNQDHGLQEVLEAIGYDFPPGCGACSSDLVPGWTITHYPSMLTKIRKDFQLTVRSRESSGPNGEASSNPQGEANGRQPFSSDTNSTPEAAASRLPP